MTRAERERREERRYRLKLMLHFRRTGRLDMLRALRATADTLAALSAEVEALALPMLDARLSANATAIAAAEAAGITDTEGDQARESAVLDGGAR